MKILLKGELGKLFGKRYDLEVVSASEAVVALGLQLPGFVEYLNKDDSFYSVSSVSFPQGMTQEDIAKPAHKVIVFSPVIFGGGGNPLLNILAGTALVAGSFLLPGVSLLGVNLSAAAGLIGASLLFQGFAQLISPIQNSGDSGEQKQSQIIDSSGRLVSQGSRVPLNYGELTITDLVPISQQVTNADWVTLDETSAQYTRVTQAPLPFEAIAKENYIYYPHPKTFKPLDASYLTNSDITSGMVIDINSSSDGYMNVICSFSSTPSGLSINTRYALQRVRLLSGVIGFPGVSFLEIRTLQGVPIWASVVNVGNWNDWDLSSFPQFQTPREGFQFGFLPVSGISYLGVGELQLFGTIGLSENIWDVVPPT